MQTKYCGGCKQTKSVQDFHRCSAKGDGLQTQCKACIRTLYERRKQLDPEGYSQWLARANEKKKAKYARDADYRKRIRAKARDAHLWSAYRLRPVDREEMEKQQEGRCACCGKEALLVVDHDHGTGRVRGLLCYTCNAGLGNFEDSVTKLHQALAYLKRHKDAAFEPLTFVA